MFAGLCAPACHAQKRALGFAFLRLNVSREQELVTATMSTNKTGLAGSRSSIMFVERREPRTDTRRLATGEGSCAREGLSLGGRTPADQQVLRTPRKPKTPRPRGEVTSRKSHSDEREVRLTPLLQFQVAPHTPAMQIPENGS